MTLKELKGLPKVRTLTGWHEMKKGEILAFLSAEAKTAGKKNGKKGGKEPKISEKSVKTPSAAASSSAKRSESAPKGKNTGKQTVLAEKGAKTEKKSVSGKEDSKSTAKSGKKNLTSEKAGKKGVKGKAGKGALPSKLAVFSDAEAERIGSTPAQKVKPPRSAAEGKKDPEMIDIGQTDEDRQRANFLKQKLLMRKTLETPSTDGQIVQDRLALSVCGPFWLHSCWEISGTLISRIRAAMGHLWHTADPVLRLYRITSDTAGLIHRDYLSDIAIQGGVYNWYISVDDPPNSFLAEIGYKARDGQFFSLVSSNIVETPQRSVSDGIGSEANWRSGSPFGFLTSPETRFTRFDTPGIASGAETAPPSAGYPTAATNLPKPTLGRLNREFDLKVDAEVVIKGKTSPDVQLTIKGERIWLKDDGSFMIRYNLPERRHVFPVVAVSRDGIEMKTVVLAVERNTKNLETVIRDQSEDE